MGPNSICIGGVPPARTGQRVAVAPRMVRAQCACRLAGADFALAEIHKLYACHDRLLVHKQELFDHLLGRWRDLFNVSFDVLLYDLTSTYFEADPPFAPDDKRRYGYSRDHRPDCVQVVIALVVTPEGLPLAYEVMPGNTRDNATLRGFLDRIQRQYGKARRIWLMDRGIPTEDVLAEMRAAEPPVQYVVGTPKGRLTRLENELLGKPWQQARPGVEVKLLPQDGELYVFAQSRDRVAKERAMRRRQLKWLWKRLAQIAAMRGDISCAPISQRTTRRSYGAITCSSSQSKKPLKISKAISPSDRSFTRTRHASKRTSSSRSWPIACTLRLDGACTLSRLVLLRAA